MSQSRMTALANDFALLALEYLAGTLKDWSSLMLSRKTKLDNKALARSNAALAAAQTKFFVSVDDAVVIILLSSSSR